MKFIMTRKPSEIKPDGSFYAQFNTSSNPTSPNFYPSQGIRIDPDSFKVRPGIMTRYGRKMLKEGAKYYSRISIGDFVI